jgi:hypothetical protein
MDAIKAILVFDGKSYDVVSLTADGLQVASAGGFADETFGKLKRGSFEFMLRDLGTGNEVELIGEVVRYERDESLEGTQDEGRVVRIWIGYPDSLKGAGGRRKREHPWSGSAQQDGAPERGAGPEKAHSLHVAGGKAGRTMAVGGGKGGVGKTLLAVNLSLALSRREKNILLLDGDIGNSNCNTLLGITRIDNGLEEYLRKGRSLPEITVSTAYHGLRLVCGAQNKVDALLALEMPRLLDDIRQLKADGL